MGQIKLYFSLALKDVFRLWSATQLQVIIISGICLPILILLGLKNGHVAELRKDLATSSEGRQVIFWSSKTGDLLSESVLKDVFQAVENAELIIPESQRLVFIVPSPAKSSDSEGNSEEKPVAEPVPLTLYSTSAGDPLLGQFGADTITGEGLELVLSESIAETLGLQVGNNITIEIKRKLGPDSENHRLQFQLKGILPSGQEGEGSSIGYADISVMKLLERFGTGAAISQWQIPAMKSLTALDLYRSMLVFCFKGQDTELTERDYEYLKRRALTVTEVTDPNIITLFGTLKETAIEDLKVYRLERMDQGEDDLVPIPDTPQLLVRQTQAEDDFIVRWNEPLKLKVNGKEYLHVGITLPSPRETGGWIKEYVKEGSPWFTYQETVDDPFTIRVPSHIAFGQTDTFSLQLDEKTQTELTNLTGLLPGAPRPVAESSEETSTKPTPDDDKKLAPDGNNKPSSDDEKKAVETDPNKTPPTAPPENATKGDTPDEQPDSAAPANQKPEGEVPTDDQVGTPFVAVPVRLLAYIHQYRRGLIQFDGQGKRFTEIPSELDYTKARLYTRTIDDVPAAVSVLASRDYAVLSESSRIAEIHQQDNSLQMLVVVVALGVFLFGVVTVFSVLVDSTDRKRGTIGILRVMGMTKFGVFFMVLFRALTIGLLAAILCCGVGYGLAYMLGLDLSSIQGLAWKPSISVLLNPRDVGLVALGAILCAALGAVMPALKASSLDPFEAIMEGRFH